MLRIIDITNVLIKYQLDQYLLRSPVTQFISRGARSLFGIKTVSGTTVERVRMALEELGPVYVKLGQMVSSRPDLFPKSLVDELSKLREQVKPFPTSIATNVIEQDLHKNIKSLFKTFDRVPVASGSVAQVHYATLHDNSEVAVKVLRPGIKAIIENDINLIKQMLPVVSMYRPHLKQIDLVKIIDELHSSLVKELDLTIEAASIEKFSANMQNCEFVVTPQVYRDLSSQHVLTMQRMSGTPIDQVNILKAQGVDIKQVVLQGLEALMLQIFYHGFFHADQHPGNLWIQPNGNRVYLDFGIMGTISDSDRKTLLKILFHLYGKNYTRVMDTVIDAGWANQDINRESLQSKLESIAALLVNRKQADFSFGNVVSQLVNTFKEFGIQVPYQFTLLAKTIVVTEGLSKQLAPDLNIQTAAEPILIKHFLKSST